MNENLNQAKKRTVEKEVEPGKVLVVDDESSTLDYFETMLPRENLGAELVGDADTAVNLLMKNQYIGVIVDGLNGQWGKVASAALAKGIKVILFTATPEKYSYHPLVESGQVKMYVKAEDSPAEFIAYFR